MHETFAQALRRLRGPLSLRDVAQLASCGKSTIADLENERRHPSPELAATLDRALHADGELAALADSGTSVMEQVDALQAGLTECLASGPMTDAGLGEWEFTVARHGRATRYRPEADHLPDLAADFGDLRLALTHRHSPAAHRRLTIAAAQMSGLMALTLLKLGDDRARSWWRTGRTAAAAADDRATLSWMYAQEAYQLYYGGDARGAVELAVRARHLAGALPCVGPALAAPLEARAHAQLGAHTAAADALTAAETALRRLPDESRAASAFGYSESQLRFHAGNAWTHLGDTTAAAAEHARALELYPTTDRMDIALVRLDQAMCTALDGDPGAAAALAAQTITALPPEHRSVLITYRARQVARRVPETRELRVLRELLALPAGERGESADQRGD
ncbi:helix-turn-helix transcriptional regulator [Streptomyces adustus]|uniref:Helix-turn-helix transcriptional regulator n=1 Tax=Streptomyces adustus TaxID=1609272 RepID=A0A5N8V7R4_9ACTN|nr:helix-turn-helix transcriptional regulator [Streptomyces adustus]MPY31300.1 helix-turn-helix transcriptional regulator [Streptomyces adustus]